MKHLACGLLLVIMASCSSGTTTTTTTTTDSNGGSNAAAPVENVNGNVPDTTNTVTPGTPKKNVNSSYAKDSLKK
ncbi:MAG: hypothetical protein ACXVBI_09965 [Flavisolibacter sp.]